MSDDSVSEDTVMQQAQGYWVSYNEYESVHYRMPGAPDGYGRAAVKYNSPLAQEGWIFITFGGPDEHFSGGPYPDLSMPPEVAAALIGQLRAAVTEAQIANGDDLEPFPYVDVTADPCPCDMCVYYRELP